MRATASTLCVLLAALSGPAASSDQDPGPAPPPAPSCETSSIHRQFDFWIGTWDVTAGDKKAGVNRVHKILGGCVLLEEWSGSGGSEGKSFNHYDPHAGRWVQTWVDRGGGSIAATPAADGSVRQFIEESKDGGKTWYVWFDGTYTRRP